MLTVTMVGAHFRPTEAKEVIKQLSIGERVELRADPDNEYDRTAVAVYAQDQHIGFIPADSNSAIFEMLMNNEPVEAEIIAFEQTLKPVLEITWGNEPTDEDRYGALGQG